MVLALAVAAGLVEMTAHGGGEVIAGVHDAALALAGSKRVVSMA